MEELNGLEVDFGLDFESMMLEFLETHRPGEAAIKPCVEMPVNLSNKSLLGFEVVIACSLCIAVIPDEAYLESAFELFELLQLDACTVIGLLIHEAVKSGLALGGTAANDLAESRKCGCMVDDKLCQHQHQPTSGERPFFEMPSFPFKERESAEIFRKPPQL